MSAAAAHTVDLDAVATRLEAALPGAVRRDLPVAEVSTYRLGGPLAVAVRARHAGDLGPIAAVVEELRPPVLVVGRGSNLLVADSGFSGLGVLLEGDFERVTLPEPPAAGAAREEEDGPVVVSAGAAVALPVLARRLAAAGWTGLEFFVGIPGSVGGAVRMNAGGHGRETRDVLARAWVRDLAEGAAGETRERDGAGLALDYRRSNVAATDVVLGAELRVSRDDPARCEARVADIVRWRREHQPGGANGGSVFRNPSDAAAGRLIDECGLKGFRVGGAYVSEKHANFFQAEPGATASEVHDLVIAVRARVEERTGVRLVPELLMIGFEEDRP